MWFVFAAVAVFALLALSGFIFEKKDKKKSDEQLEAIKRQHNVSLQVVSQAGYIAFCDEEQKVYCYKNALSKLDEFKYSNILKYKKSLQVNGISFWALTPTYTEYISGEIGLDNLGVLIEKLTSIIDENARCAEKEYFNIASIPQNAATVRVKDCSGYNACISHIIKDLKDAFIWSDTENLYLLAKFDLPDFRIHPEMYKLISIEKKNIVDLSQSGNIHYTTEVHGGDGGGSSIKGAIIGGAIAGEAGAIIGSRKSTNPISSSTKQIDDRATNLKVLDINNNFCEVQFEYNDFYVISKLMKTF